MQYAESGSKGGTIPAQTFGLLACLYLAQGLPAGLLAHVLPVIWRQQGVDLAIIGLLKLMALPWVLKALWAPWLERHLGRGAGAGYWIVGLQTGMALALLMLAWFGEMRELVWLLVGVVLLINTLSATQDIISDGLAVRLLPERLRGWANSLQVAGYKIGMIMTGSGLLIVMPWLGWHWSVGLVAVLVLILLVPVIASRALVSRAEASVVDVGDARFLQVWRRFLRPGVAGWLGVLVSFKAADSLASGMIKPVLVDTGWSTGAIGAFTLVASGAGLLGAALGGWAYSRWSAQSCLLLLGAGQALGLALFGLIPFFGAKAWAVYGIGMFEQMMDGGSTVVLFAVMMHFCRRAWAGADYTLQASILVLASGVCAALGGGLAQWLGFQVFFTAAGLMGLICLWPVMRVRKQLDFKMEKV